MADDSDQEVTDLDIHARTWNKLETTMKLFGFREGAAEGKNLSLQEGFNLGYSDGFKLGEYLGMSKGIVNCESELEVNKSDIQKQALEKLSSQSCLMCLEEKTTRTDPSKEIPFENIHDLIKQQQSHGNEIITSLKSSGLKPYFEKG